MRILRPRKSGGHTRSNEPQTVFERVPIALYRTTTTGAIRDANNALVKLLGYPDRETLLATPVRAIYARPEQREECREFMMRDGQVVGFEAELRCYDGRSIWVQDNASVVVEDGVAYYEGALIDVTERRRATDVLRQSEERYRRLFSQTPVALWEEDFSAVGAWLEELSTAGVEDLREYLIEHPSELRHAISLIEIVDVNPAGIALVGADSKEQLIGGFVEESVAEETIISFVEQVATAWEGRERLELEISGTTLAGERIDCVLHWVAPVEDTGKIDLSRVVVALVDMTEYKRTQEQLERLVHSKDQLVSSVSHELRTPLTAVVGFAEELKDHWESYSPTERTEWIRLIAEQSNEAASIVQDLLVAARAGTGALTVAPEEIRLGEQARDVLRGLEPELASRIVLRDGTASAWADPSRVRQILRNLCTNAARYGGESIEVETFTDGPLARAVVRDNGPGISEDQWERIFDPYCRVHESPGQPGSIGLGLTVSRTLARLMGGDLTYRYENERSVLELTLPKTNGHGTGNRREVQ
ncbi:MAG: PAS domain S-box protein [Actinobacteria bacterium]|nr:PAS domain S-box protein [Actinomycetota bacterium]